MNAYLAARCSRHPEMRVVRDILQSLGHIVTSRWIDCHAGKYPTSFTADQLNNDLEYCAAIAQYDWADLREADAVISFVYAEGGGQGGRHVEFGLGLAFGKRTILVGPREHVFHTLPQVEYYTSWTDCVAVLGAEAREMSGT